MFIIKEISANETFAVRLPVLREGKPIESCAFANDNDVSTVHFGLFQDVKLAGVASLFKQPNAVFNRKQYQLRGMAILKEYQRKGYGEALINKIEQYAISNGAEVLWFNARESAVPFYSALNYEIIGHSFIIEGIGAHYIMYKFLQ